MNRNYIELFQSFHIAWINVCKEIRGQWMRDIREALTLTTGRIIALYQYQYFMPLVLSFTDGKCSFLSEVSLWTCRAVSAALQLLSDLFGLSFFVCYFVCLFVFSQGLCSTEAAGELMTWLRTACKPTCSTNPWSRKQVLFYFSSRISGEFV